MKKVTKLIKKMTQPRNFGDNIHDDPIFCLSAGTRDSLLVLGGPGNQVVTKEYCIAGCQSLSIRTTGPIGIRIDNELL